MEKIRVGIIGFGRMGEKYLTEMRASGKWDIAYICDVSSGARAYAREIYPDACITGDEDEVFNDPDVKVVGLFTLADSRYEQVKKALATGKHIIAEKPVADTLEHERELVELVGKSDLFTAVNLYLRNSWYHNCIKDFISTGEIGDLAIIRVCHMTPGLAPGEGHEYEGPAFHDCGMHYVDIAKWYAGCGYRTWHAQGLRMWSYKDPWWLQCHGTFENGVVFDITQGFVYGQLAKDQTHNSYVDIIGTKGIARMTHDFRTAVVELRGKNVTERIEKPFGGKNIDRLCDLFADSVISGKRAESLPTFRDSMVASEYAWKFLDDARTHELPAIGTEAELEAIRHRRSIMKDGYGLLHKR